MTIKLQRAPFRDEFISDFISLTSIIFGDEASQGWLDSLKWRLENMPELTVFIAENNSGMIGYKVGYAIAQNRYYSWLGGIAPAFRRQGIASGLMQSQLDWLDKSPFKVLETHVMEHNQLMISLNTKAGFEVIGNFQKDGSNCLIMQKTIKYI